jgi:hypothetical protein
VSEMDQGKDTQAGCLGLAEAIACIPADLNWLIGKGKTRPDEPPYGVQLLDGLTVVAETEGDDLCAAIRGAIAIVGGSNASARAALSAAKGET